MQTIRKVILVSSVIITGLFVIGASDCNRSLDVTVYVSTPKSGGMNWANATAGTKGFLPYANTDKFVCFTPNDAQTLVDYCKASQTSN